MSTLAQELSALKTAEDKITGNKVANFAYDDYAYEHDDANGVDVYNVNNHQNIPNGTANILKVNPTILTKGWRAQASAITRMLLDHFLGRCSYNLNKVNDHFSSLLTTLGNYLGVANGIATLDSNGKVLNAQLKLGVANGIATLDTNGYVPTAQLSPTEVVKTVNSHVPSNGNVDVSKSDVGLGSVVNTGDSATPVSGGTTKFTTGGAYTELAKKAPNDHSSVATTYGVATKGKYGHVRLGNPLDVQVSDSEDIDRNYSDTDTICFFANSGSMSLSVNLYNRNLALPIRVNGVKFTGNAIQKISQVINAESSLNISLDSSESMLVAVTTNIGGAFTITGASV